MSLANLGLNLAAMRFRTRMAEEQLTEFSELLAQWFLDSNQGAREFLIEVAKLHRKAHPVRAIYIPINGPQDPAQR